MPQTSHVPSAWETAEKATKGAPATGVLAALKTLAAAREKLTREENQANYDAATKALTALETACTAALPKYAAKDKADKFGTLRQKTEAIKRQIPDAKKELDDVYEAIGLRLKQEKAGSQKEAVYETLWAAFDKDRHAIASGPSLALYTSALTKMPGLLNQADAIINTNNTEDYPLGRKYKKQKTILASINTELTNGRQTYIQKLNACKKSRVDLLPVLDSVKPMLNQTITLLNGLKGKATAAQTAGDQAKLAVAMKAAAMAAKGAVDKYNEVSEHYKPGTILRDGKDSSAAGIHKDDQAAEIAPLNTPLFTSFKANSDLKRTIDTVAAEIARLFVPAAAGGGGGRAGGPTIGARRGA